MSFRTDWFDLLAAQGPVKSLLQHYSSKASALGQLRGMRWGGMWEGGSGWGGHICIHG